MIAVARRNSSLPEAMPSLRLEFVYDYMSRRCVKLVFDKSPFEAFAPMGGDAIMEGSAAAIVQNDDAPAATFINVPKVGMTMFDN